MAPIKQSGGATSSIVKVKLLDGLRSGVGWSTAGRNLEPWDGSRAGYYTK